jgi:hypothetical protein
MFVSIVGSSCAYSGHKGIYGYKVFGALGVSYTDVKIEKFTYTTENTLDNKYFTCADIGKCSSSVASPSFVFGMGFFSRNHQNFELDLSIDSVKRKFEYGDPIITFDISSLTVSVTPKLLIFSSDKKFRSYIGLSLDVKTMFISVDSLNAEIHNIPHKYLTETVLFSSLIIGSEYFLNKDRDQSIDFSFKIGFPSNVNADSKYDTGITAIKLDHNETQLNIGMNYYY